MSPMIIKKSLYAFVVMVMLIAGCSNPNDQSYFNPDTGKHPAGWLPAGHMTAANAKLAVCAECHGSDFAGGIAQIACGLCHMGGVTSMHPTGWLRDACFNHGTYALNNGTSACANSYCHGAGLTGVAHSGPSCTKCHNPVPTTSSCGSCHGIPPATGAHVVHTSPPLSYIVCGSCHDVDCAKHGVPPALVGISTMFYAKSAGTVTFNGATCSKVSCHGGQATPNWAGGVIDVTTDCLLCHAYGTAEYNSFRSGQHDRHVNQEGLACTDCHDTSLLAVNHFTRLNTSALEGPAWKTIKASIQYNGVTCANPCHDPQNWR